MPKYKAKTKITSSKILHVREVARVLHRLDHLESVLDVFVEVFDPRVEDVGKTMFSQVLDREDPVNLGKGIFFINPKRA